jgi:hypothetical protein
MTYEKNILPNTHFQRFSIFFNVKIFETKLILLFFCFSMPDYFCSCAALCKKPTKVSKRTYERHAKHRNRLTVSLNDFISNQTAGVDLGGPIDDERNKDIVDGEDMERFDEDMERFDEDIEWHGHDDEDIEQQGMDREHYGIDGEVDGMIGEDRGGTAQERQQTEELEHEPQADEVNNILCSVILWLILCISCQHGLPDMDDDGDVRLDDIKITMAFINALKSATLKADGLDEEVL